jgi:hypothetical protein
VVIQVLLKDIKLNPLLSLYYYAPVRRASYGSIANTYCKLQ